MGQAAVELPGGSNDTCRCIQNAMKSVSDGPWRPGQHSVVAIHMICNEGMNKVNYNLDNLYLPDSTSDSRSVRNLTNISKKYYRNADIK